MSDPTTPPSTKGANGRTRGGRFARGWRGGPGNPHAKKTAMIRASLFRVTTREDADEIARKLVAMAKGGDLAAIREFFDRSIGKATPGDLTEQIEQLRQAIEHLRARNGTN